MKSTNSAADIVGCWVQSMSYGISLTFSITWVSSSLTQFQEALSSGDIMAACCLALIFIL